VVYWGVIETAAVCSKPPPKSRPPIQTPSTNPNPNPSCNTPKNHHHPKNNSQILSGRSEKRQLGSRKGNNFSTATFGAAAANDDADYERAEQARRELEEARKKGGQSAEAAREYWSKILPDAVAAFDEQVRGGFGGWGGGGG